MTGGQRRAITELKRLNHSAPDDFEIDIDETPDKGWISVRIGIRVGKIEWKPGGLRFRERESFLLCVPEDFPFRYPKLIVPHLRFAGFPHVVWGVELCLYQSAAQWNPEDGLYGYFDRLKSWLERAAVNDMDPVEGALEPPHHATDFDQIPIVVRANAPVAPGVPWLGVARLEKFPTRIDIVSWHERLDDETKGQPLALAAMLPQALPMEFPLMGKALVAEFEKQGLDRRILLNHLAIASLFTEKGSPVHVVVGLPMRRSREGDKRIHIAVWSIPASVGDYLRSVLPQETDNNEIEDIRSELRDLLWRQIEESKMYWCRVLEDRDEIVLRRDTDTPLSRLADKNVLILGCGALGSWVAEMIARSRPATLDLVDNGIVKPGILVRQNFSPSDYGENKAKSLARRIKNTSQDVQVTGYRREAHSFIFENPSALSSYDLVVDCTAAPIFQMKLERDWSVFNGDTPSMISMAIDAQAKHLLAICIGKRSPGGIWDGCVRLKHQLCLEADTVFVPAFYSLAASDHLFQPEPGCSDPTFVGSAADVLELSSIVLNQAIESPPGSGYSHGVCYASQRAAGIRRVVRLNHDLCVRSGDVRIYVSEAVIRGARSYVKESARRRSPNDETGGLLWGRWDESVGVIWIFDLSGPPPDSSHDHGHFICGIEGTREEHEKRFERSGGTSGFIGFWHTHPKMDTTQSTVDMGGMATLVSKVGDNQRRALMLIFGEVEGGSRAGFYVYESLDAGEIHEFMSVGEEHVNLDVAVL